MKKVLTIFIVVMLCISIFAACQNTDDNSKSSEPVSEKKIKDDSDNSSEKTQDKEPMRFTYVTPMVGHPYCEAQADGVRAAAEELGVDVDIVGPTQIDADEQISAIEAAIASKVNGIITQPINPVSFTPSINKAVDQGIPVVLIDTDVPDSKRNAFLGTSNVNVGKSVADVIIKAIDEKGQIAIITSTLDSNTLVERIDAFKNIVADYPEVEIVAIEASNAEIMLGYEKALAILKAYPQVKAIWGVGTTDVVSAAKAVEEVGKAGEIALVGCDDMDETLNYIRNGVVLATTVQQPYQMGYKGLHYLKDLAEGKTLENPIVDTGVIVVDSENVDSYK